MAFCRASVSRVDAAQSEYPASLTSWSDVLRDRGSFCLIPTDNTCICAEVYQGTHLGRTDGSVAAGAKDHFIDKQVLGP